MTDRELTKAAIAIYRKACEEIENLIKAQGVPVYTSMYGMRRWFKHNDNSQMVVNGRELLRDIDGGRVKLSKGNMLVQATPESVKKLKNKIIKDIIKDCRHSISRASAELVKSESLMRELIKSGKISEKHLRKILQRERL